MSEEQTVQNQTAIGVEEVRVSSNIPYSIINKEVEGNNADVFAELTLINEYYNKYHEGSKFTTEGSSGDYIPSMLRFRVAARLINKEARFLFGEKPDILVQPKGDVGKLTQEARDNITTQQDLINTILDSNNFEEKLLKAAKDCFIGKRVAVVANFNEEYGVSVNFLDSLSFVYDVDPADSSKLVKFVCFTVIKDRTSLADRQIFKKKYTMGNDGFAWLEEEICDGRGVTLEVVTEHQPTKLTRIPARVILNDGLTANINGESEIKDLCDYESHYSKLANADIDAERKSMNQIRYTIDMDETSTKALSTSPGSYWDLQSDQNADNPKPAVGVLSCSMDYSAALSTTLDRIRSAMHEQLDVPDVTLENMAGTITSGKALKSIYWPLIVRCKEKMKTWGPSLAYIIDVIIEGAIAYPNTVKRYTNNFVIPVSHEIKILQNLPLPEDEEDEKTMDLAEVAAQTMSRKAYMKKWHEATDDEAQEELEQMAMERQMLEESSTAAASDFGGNLDSSSASDPFATQSAAEE